MLNILDELDSRLTRAAMHCPDLYLKLLKIQKHVKYGLNHPNEVDLKELLKDTVGKMTAMMVIHHELEDDFSQSLHRARQELES